MFYTGIYEMLGKQIVQGPPSPSFYLVKAVPYTKYGLNHHKMVFINTAGVVSKISWLITMSAFLFLAVLNTSGPLLGALIGLSVSSGLLPIFFAIVEWFDKIKWLKEK